MVVFQFLSVKTLSRTILKSHIVICLLISSFFVVPNVYAETDEEKKKKIAATLSVITYLLLSEDTPGGPLEVSLDNSYYHLSTCG